jgi:chromosome segregation ATPase
MNVSEMKQGGDTMKSSTESLISALRVLARDIQTHDGVVNTCLEEAAGRLEELQRANKKTLADLAVAIERRDDSYAEIKSVRKELAKAIAERTPHDYGLLKGEVDNLKRELSGRLEELQNVQDKLENQEEISRDLYYERGLLHAEINFLKEQPLERTNIRQNPSRLEIAAMIMQGFVASNTFGITIADRSLEYSDALIAAAKEGK